MTDSHPENEDRRDFLYVATGAVAAVGTAAVLAPRNLVVPPYRPTPLVVVEVG